MTIPDPKRQAALKASIAASKKRAGFDPTEHWAREKGPALERFLEYMRSQA